MSLPGNHFIWTTIARAIIVAIGGIAIGFGWTDESTVQAVLGFVMTLIGAIWGVSEKVGVISTIEAKDQKIDRLQETVQVKDQKIDNLEKDQRY